MTNTLIAAPRRRLRVISFGFGHGPAPAADHVADVRRWFRDPHTSPAFRKLTGEDHAVVVHVLGTQGVDALIDRLLDLVEVYLDLDEGGDEFVLAVGCVGGRHRAHVIADQLVLRACSRGRVAVVEHRDRARGVLVGASRAAPGP